MVNSFTNIAFISYKREDEKWAKWLQKKLEHYQLPVEIRKQNVEFAERPRHVFKDTTDLSGGVLEKAIKAGLESSKFLIVICSPRAAQSPWVCKEVQEFIDLGREEYIVPFIVDGEPYAKNPENECFPAALKMLAGDRELLGVNINENGREAAIVKVVSVLFSLHYDTLWQRHEKEKKKQRVSIGVGVFLFVSILLSFSVYIWKQNIELKNSLSLFSAYKAERLLDDGDAISARKVAFDGLNFSYTVEAEKAFRRSMEQNSIVLSDPSNSFVDAYYTTSNEIITVSAGNRIEKWDAYTGVLVDSLNFVDEETTYADFARDGELLLTASNASDKVFIWDTKRMALVNTISGFTRRINSVRFSPNGEYIITSTEDSVLLWSTETGALEAARYYWYPQDASINDDCSVVVICSSGFLTAWYLDNNYSHNFGHDRGTYNKVSFAPYGSYIVASYHDEFFEEKNYSVRVFNSGIWRELTRMDEHSARITCCRFSKGGYPYIISSSDNNLILWDFHYGKTLHDFKGHLNSLNSVRFGKDGEILITASKDKSVRLFEIINQHYTKWYSGSRCNRPFINYSPTGSLLATFEELCEYDGYTTSCESNIEIHDTESDSLISRIYLGTLSPGDIPGVYFEFTHDGKNLVVLSQSSLEMPVFIRIFDVESGDCLSSFNSEIGFCLNFYAAIFHNDKMLLSITDLDEIGIIDLNTGKITKRFEKTPAHILKKYEVVGEYSEYAVRQIALSPDEKYVTAGTDASSVFVWSTESGKIIKSLKGHTESVNYSCFSHDGNYIVSASADNTIKLWDVNSGVCLKTFLGHTDIVTSASFSSSDHYIVSSSFDGSVKVWDRESGLCLQTYIIFDKTNDETYDKFVYFALFNGTDDVVVSASQSSAYKLWPFLSLSELIEKYQEQSMSITHTH